MLEPKTLDAWSRSLKFDFLLNSPDIYQKNLLLSSRLTQARSVRFFSDVVPNPWKCFIFNRIAKRRVFLNRT